MAVAASESSVQPGGTVTFTISAWASGQSGTGSGESGTVKATAVPSNKTPAIGAPTFTVGCASKTACETTIPKAQPGTPQVEAQVSVPKSAASGDKITFTATVTVTGKTSLETTKTATVTVKKPSTSPSPTKSSTATNKSNNSPSSSQSPAGGGGTTAGVGGLTYSTGTSLPIGNVPLVGSVPGVSSTIPAGSASSLFPQISPTAVPSPSPGSPAEASKQRPVADSSTIPLSLGSSEFGAQILGLIVLLLGVAIAVTRVSLRKTRTIGRTGSGS